MNLKINWIFILKMFKPKRFFGRKPITTVTANLRKQFDCRCFFCNIMRLIYFVLLLLFGTNCYQWDFNWAKQCTWPIDIEWNNTLDHELIISLFCIFFYINLWYNIYIQYYYFGIYHNWLSLSIFALILIFQWIGNKHTFTLSECCYHFSSIIHFWCFLPQANILWFIYSNSKLLFLQSYRYCQLRDAKKPESNMQIFI